MIRLSELKLSLSALPLQLPRAADAPAETDADRHLPPHPDAALHELAAQTLGIAQENIATLSVFKRSFDARKQNLLVVYIVDLSLHHAAQETQLLQQHAAHPHIQARLTWCGVRLCKRLPTGARATANVLWWLALGRAAYSPHWCWRKWA